MASPNGGIIGVVNPTSFGKCTVTTVTSGSSTLTTQPGTRITKIYNEYLTLKKLNLKENKSD